MLYLPEAPANQWGGDAYCGVSLPGTGPAAPPRAARPPAAWEGGHPGRHAGFQPALLKKERAALHSIVICSSASTTVFGQKKRQPHEAASFAFSKEGIAVLGNNTFSGGTNKELRMPEH